MIEVEAALDELKSVVDACERRDKRALYAAFAKAHERIRDGPVDISRVRAMAHCYASQIFGWEVEDA